MSPNIVLTRGSVTLPEVYAFLNIIESDPEQFESICLHEFKNFPSEDVQRLGGELVFKRKSAAGEFSGIIATLFQYLGFLDDPAIQQCLSGSDFSLSVLGERKAAIFLIIPIQYVEVWAGFLRVLITSAIAHKQKILGQKVLILADESSQLGRFDLLLKSVTLGRGFGQRTWTIWQDTGQIVRNYGQAGLTTFLGSSQVRQFYSIRDFETASLISKMLGDTTFFYDDPLKQAEAKKAKRHVIHSIFGGGNDPFQAAFDAAHFEKASNHQETIRRPLMTPDEILNMPDNKQILFISGIDCPPIYADRRPYFKEKIMKGAFSPSPFHPKG